MQISDAAKLLNLTGDITPEIVKAAYIAATKKYHPDINPAGENMMKMVNAAYDAMKSYNGILDVDGTPESTPYPDAVNDALNAIIDLPGLNIEICGAWIWVSGNTREHKDTLKETGFKYASKKKMWNFRPEGWRSKSRGQTSMEEIRYKYGSDKPRARNAQAALV